MRWTSDSPGADRMGGAIFWNAGGYMGLSSKTPDVGPVTGLQVHPDAPATPAGRGYFREPAALLSDRDPEAASKPALGPAVRLFAGDHAGKTAQQASSGAAKPPPATSPASQVIASIDNDFMDVELEVRIVADDLGAGHVSTAGAVTTCQPSAGVRNPTPVGYETLNGKISKVTRRFTLKGHYEIKTSYGTGAKPSDPSMYGRGTTSKDKADGNTSLGFHEWCHQQEFWEYLVRSKFPVHEANIGDTPKRFRAADAEFAQAVRAFFGGIGALGPAVDDVGYTKSRCKADGKC